MLDNSLFACWIARFFFFSFFFFLDLYHFHQSFFGPNLPMRLLLPLLVVLCALTEHVKCSLFGWFGPKGIPKHNHVIDFDDSTLHDTFARAHYSLIYFYMDNCQYCAHFNPTFEYLSTLLNNDTTTTGLDIQVIKTNGKKNARLNLLFDVTHYPTLKLLDYKTKKITTFSQIDRTLETLLSFLRNNVEYEIYPNYSNLASSITVVNNDNFSELVKNGNVVIVFTMSYIPGWENYNLQSHFYQELARERPSIKFALLDMSTFNYGDLITKFSVSNFPSAMYFAQDGHFKTFNTHSQNHLTNDKLDDPKLRAFVDNLEDTKEDFGTWFNSTEDLIDLLEDSVYDGHKNVPVYGFRVKQSEITGEEEDVEEEYNKLIEHIEL